MDIDKFQNNSIIICELDDRKHILKEFSKNKKMINIKFFSMNEFLSNYYFSYDEKAIYFLVNKYGYDVDVALKYLSNLYLIEDKVYNSEKLKKLKFIKNELLLNNLLIFNKDFKDFIMNKKIYVYGYDYLDLFEENLLNDLGVEVINDEIGNYKHVVYKANKLEEEVEFVAKEISKLIVNGIDINKIKLANINDEYINIIERIFNFYNIPINLNNKVSIYSTNIGQVFLNNYNDDIKKSIDSIIDMDISIVNKIINICNRYTFINGYEEVKTLIINDLKNTYIDDIKYENAINISNLKFISDDEYVFLMNFNLGSLPKIVKDEDYITDSIKDEVSLYKVYEINKFIKKNTINRIKSIKNLIITYKEVSGKNQYYPSLIIEEMGLNVLNINLDVKKSYSKISDKINLSRKIDNLIKYGVKDNDLSILNNSYNIRYSKYDNSFKGIDKGSLYEFLNNELSLSYSTLNIYNKCAFRYYMNSILKVDLYEYNFMALIGSIFHYVLETCMDNKDNVESEIVNYLKSKNIILSPKENFFISKLTKEIKFVIDTINMQLSFSSLSNVLTEEKVYINKDKNIKVTFSGIIDKVLYKEEDETIVVLIDYKTGSTNIDLKYVPFGLEMQLPIYIHLARNIDKLNNVKFSGFYIQQIFNKEVNISSSKSYEFIKKDNLKLNGYSTSTLSRLKYFDSSYEESQVIKGMKLKLDGNFYSSAKVLSDEQIDILEEVVDNKIDECIDNILEAKFDINPKKNSELNCCDYCEYKDLCFMKEKDYIKIEPDKELTFLGGEEDA